MSHKKKISVISICFAKHSDVWRLTSELLPKNVQADEYLVYVPANEIEFFQKITNPKVEIRAQEDLGSIFRDILIDALNSTDNSKRLGWYLQQLYKIEAMRISKSEIVAIWDADCVPVAEINLVDLHESPLYLDSSRELHQPYFQTIQRLLGMTRVQDLSFVIPGFPMKHEWVVDFVNFVEKKHGIPWYEAIIRNTDMTQVSGFSETETLGTWLANKYPGQWSVEKGTWERLGQSRFGYAKKFTPSELEILGKNRNLQIITFENWDVRGLRRIYRSIKFKLLHFR